MITLHNIKERAELLSLKTETGSITPEEVGQLIIDLSNYTQAMERDGSTLGIRKVYPTLSAMQADTTPVGDNGKPLKKGNLVAIYKEATATTDPNSGLVSMWTGSGWASVARIGTALRHDYTAIEDRLNEVARVQREELKPADETLRTAIESLTNDLRVALERIEYTAEEQAKVAKIKTDGESTDYLGADGAYHALPDAPEMPTYSIRSEQVGKQQKLTLTSSAGITSEVLLKGTGSGSGAGFLNITREVPLRGGYYTLGTALTALKTLDYEADARRGTILTIETAEGKWQDYRYIGSTTDDTTFYSEPMWQAYATPVSDEHINRLIAEGTREVEVATSLDDTARPIASNVVKQAIEDLQDLTLDSDTEPTDGGTKVTLSRNGRQVTEFVVAGGGGGGSSTQTKAVVTATLSDKRIKLGDKVSLTYGYTHYADGAPDGTPALVSILIKRGVQTIATEEIGTIPSGTTASIDLSKYISSADSYSIMVTAKYEEDGVLKERKAQALLSVVNLSISLFNRPEIETYISAGGYNDGDTANIIISVKGGARELRMYIDGDTSNPDIRTISGTGSRQTFVLPMRNLSAGSHSLQFVASVDGLHSNSLYVDILKIGSSNPFVGLIFSRPDGRIFERGEVAEVLAYQYESTSWDYIAIAKATGGLSTLTLSSPSGENTFTAPRSYQTLNSRFVRSGLQDYHYKVGAYSKTFAVKVEPSTLQGIGIKEGVALEMLASGRSNVERKPDEWGHNGGKNITTFTGVDWDSSGWVRTQTGNAPYTAEESVLRLINGAKALINYKPFAVDAKTRGLTLTFEAKITNVRRNDGAIISSIDSDAERLGSFAGFRITPNKVVMPTGGTLEFQDEEGNRIVRALGLEIPYAYGEYYSITLVVHPASDQKNIRLYINGVLSKADTYQDTIFRHQTPQGILIDSQDADIDLRYIRIYETALSDDEVLNNYITDRPTLAEMDSLRERNDVLNSETGDVSYDRLVSRGKAALSIAMADGGLERLWGKSTDTKTDYTFTELIFRSPYGKAYDLKVTDGIIRRQGTSTSTYPIKNLRIYLQKSKTSKVYRNVGKGQEDQWEEVEDRTYIMREGAKPMKIINLKTDYADSSLCYNTGTAILLNDYLVAKNGNLRNAGQKADPSARMAIDGIPIDVFTSDTPEGAKRYCGQFQFNNDKSKSGYLFGQTKKDGTEIALEFINNTNPVANFNISASSVEEQLGRTGTDGFDASVEFLYPEKDYLWNSSKPEEVAPNNIKQAVIRLWQWIKDCSPSGVDPSTMTEAQIRTAFVSDKFRREVSQYFDVTNLTMWWVLTDYHMSVDQRVKNTFYRTWGDGIWWLTYYDGDTAFGKRNDAFLAYDYNINRDTRDAQRSKFAFEGHNSRLWCLVLANLDAELRASAKTLRTTLTNSVYLSVFNNQIMGNWSERQYNKSGIYKYIKPTYTDYNGGGTMNYIFALNGTMYAFRNQLIERRFSMLDAKYLVGQYESDVISGYIGKDDADTQIKITAGDEYYFSWKTQNGNVTEHQGVNEGEIATFNFRDAMSQNDPVRLIGASRIRKIDFATTAPNLQGSWNFNSCRLLEELVAPTSNPRATQWYPLLGRISGIKRIDLTGQVGITGTEDEQARTFDVSSHSGLQELKLNGTSVRAINLAGGSPITRLELPASLNYLRLRALPKLALSGLVLADWSKVATLELAGCPLIDWQELLAKCSHVERLRIEGVNIEDNGSLLARLMTVKGIDANGSGVDTCELVGKYQLTEYIDDTLFKQYQAHFPSLHIRQPQYTILEMDDRISESANISNLDNSTGARFGKPYVPSAHIAKILSDRFGCMGKQAEKGKMKIFPLHNEDWRRYNDHKQSYNATEVKTNGEEGDMFIYEPQYWYKGVNDIRNSKKYACFASGDAPDEYNPEVTKVIYHSEISKIPNKKLQPVGTLGSSMIEDGKYTIYRVDGIDAYKRVRFNTVLAQGGVGAGFFREDGTLVSSVSVETSNDYFEDGMYYIIDVPATAKVLYYTVSTVLDKVSDYVVLSNSDKIEDMEPFWVEHKPCLVGVFKGMMRNGRYGSFVDPNSHNEQTDGLSIIQLRSMLAGRNMHPITYEEHKDIANLAMFKYGTRCPESIVGYNNNASARDSIQINIPYLQSAGNDTLIRGDDRFTYVIMEGGISRKEQSTYYNGMDSQILMGYRRLSGGYTEYADGIVTKPLAGEYRRYLQLVDAKRGTTNFATGQTNGDTMRGTHFGRYMDVINTTKSRNSSITTYYGVAGGSIFEYQGNANEEVLVWGGYASNPRWEQPWRRASVVSLTQGNSGTQNRATRAVYSGDIEVMRDIQAFLQVPFNF